jgi:membrane protease YdiL (CAAX protease family)
MNPMAKLPAGFGAALLTGWAVLTAAGIAYARLKSIPNQAAVAVLAAFLIEYPFYLVPACPTLRDRLTEWRLQAYTVASAVLPYLACCCGAVPFQWNALVRLAALGLGMGLWYAALPTHAVVDLAFLALIPAVLLSKVFDSIYVSLVPGWKDLVILGHLSLAAIAAVVLLVARRVPDPGYGFLPSRREWWIGAIHFLYFLAAGIPLALILGVVRTPHWVPVWKAAASFLGFLWVLSLSEEFLVRGVLWHWIERWTGSLTAALLLSSVVFGLIHLWYGGFPNFRWVALTAVLGWFCGRARLKAGSIRAGMVTHALVVTARLFVA